MNTTQEFDQYADDYNTQLNSALSVTGEAKEYFAAGRVNWLMQCLKKLNERPTSAVDYGCGIGETCTLLSEKLGLKQVIGLDASPRSLEIARQHNSSAQQTFFSFAEYDPRGDMDLVYCNGTFHHIPVAERVYFVDYIRRCLRPGGLFALWENNPWNPGTRYVMSRCPFDHDAVTLAPPVAARLVEAGGFEVVKISHVFFFPRFLKIFRGLEPFFSKVPLGAQYQILCRKPLA